ncbi:alpha/beta hydrolase [Thalassobaculum sp.]|uniref:alpha/beta fold hydrolase n=1 Tax=Thalassobaculum sp. TaxID=2022740 RepID=UPI0032EE7D11
MNQTSSEQTVHAGGHAVFFNAISTRPTGLPDAPPLVFLHEGLGAITMWKEFPARLCAAVGRAGIIIDRWGHGRSEPLDGPVRGGRSLDYHAREAETLIEILDRLAIPQAVLFGHSDGGTIALLAAANAPQRIAACITEAAHVFVEPVTLAGIREALAAYEAPGSRLRAGLARHHGEQRVDRVFYGWTDAWLSPPFADWAMTDRLAEIRCPVLAIQGLDDQYGTPEQVHAIVGGVAGPAQPLLLEACGHAPHADCEATVTEAVRRTLATL